MLALTEHVDAVPRDPMAEAAGVTGVTSEQA